uniref:EPS8 signaling adaptor L3 n=1 Tax=Taeniopygia guttata TaxID=59729 RepID=A0A674HT68_TAEGU
PCHLTLRVPSDQRKDYGQTLLKLQNDFQHHVEHLLTMHLERELRSVEDCLGRLRELEEQGRLWGQDVILEVREQELVLSDVESKEELEAFPLGSVQGCWAGPENAVLAVRVQERSPPRSSVLLFQCQRLGAETLRSSLEKVLRQRKEEQSHHFGHRYEPPEPDPRLSPRRGAPPQRGLLASDYGESRSHPAHPPSPHPQEILNHVLRDLERFMGRLKAALSSASAKKKPKKPGRKGGGSLGGCSGFSRCRPPALPLQRCPQGMSTRISSRSPGLAPAVRSPLLLPEALQLLEESLGEDDYGVWKSLGTAWNKSRWAPAPRQRERRSGFEGGVAVPTAVPSPLSFPNPLGTPFPVPVPRTGTGSPLPAQGLVRALYDFQARNSQELSVRRGDTLQVLDQQRKWWLVQDERGDRGHVPGNILEPLPEPGYSDSPPTLQPGSSPAEVTAWLTDKGFSRITVRTLGVLRGHELLQMSPAELRGVCPEEWRRVLFKLHGGLGPLGQGPPAWGRDPHKSCGGSGCHI